jgi:cation:H+ antiporter
MSLFALAFFGGAVFAVSRDGSINAADGMILVGIFLFWQMVHVFDVLKTKTRNSMKIKKRIWFDFFIIGLCAWGIFSSTDNLIEWISLRKSGLFSKPHLGVLSGILMVLPNAVLCVYYAAAGRADIAYSSQIGDCHICIPLCIGIFAMGSTIIVFPSYQMAIYILMGATALHCFFMAFSGKLPRLAGVILTGFYVLFLYKGGL